MVQLQIISDLHLEHRPGPIDYEEFVKPSANIIGLLGDIGSPYDPKLEHFIDWCSLRFQHVLYIPGNHEYYSQYGDSYQLLHQKLITICEKFNNVHLLDNKTFEFEDVVFIGSTLWSDIPPSKDGFIANYMNDFRLIFVTQGQQMMPCHARIEFAKNKTYLEKTIGEHKSKSNKIVVLTHHAPSFQGTSAPKYETSDSRFAFASQLSCNHNPSLIRLWCCGHTHHNFHHHKEGYELISNQIGYGKAIDGYNKEISISL